MTKTTDDVGTCSLGDCSLRSAVIEANGNPGADTITLPAGTYALTLPDGPGVPDPESGDLDIVDDVTIRKAHGVSGGVVIDGLGVTRLIEVPYPGFSVSVTLERLRLDRGSAPALSGGGLLIGAPGLFNLDRVAVTNAAGGGGIVVTDSFANVRLAGANVSDNAGGGISFAGTLRVVDTQISGNGRDWGGITGSGNLEVYRSDIERNISGSSGGGIHLLDGTLLVQDSTLRENRAEEGRGGGIRVSDGAEKLVTGSTIEDNDALVAGGGVYVGTGTDLLVEDSTIWGNSSPSGGGLAVDGTLNLTHSTVSGNTSASSGGGLFVGSEGRAFLSHVTISANLAEFGSGIHNLGEQQWGLAVSAANPGGDCAGAEPTVQFASFVGTPGCGRASGDGDAMLGDLEANGGPTLTHLPRDGSPLIDGGAGFSCGPYDQRGYLPPDGRPCDIGAVEVEGDGNADLRVQKVDNVDPAELDGDLVYELQLVNEGPGRVWGAQLVDEIPLSEHIVAVSAGPNVHCEVTPRGEEGENGVRCELGTIAAGQDQVHIHVRPTTGGDIVNEATGSAGSTDPDPDNNRSDETTTVGFLVTNTEDSGPGSLRQAILDANANPGEDVIAFFIPGGGVHTIVPASALPAITDQVRLDGYTQPGSNPNTLDVGNNAVLLVELDGNGGVFDGLRATAGAAGTRIRGLVVNDFNGDAIELNGVGGIIVEGNYVGTNPAGDTAVPSRSGIYMESSPGNRIGGMSPAERNVLVANQNFPIWTQTPDAGGGSALIQGNYVGTNAQGTAVLGVSGIRLSNAENVIGGVDPGAGNVIANQGRAGVHLDETDANRNTIQGNHIGVSADGTAVIGTFTGVSIERAAENLVGGSDPAARNVIVGSSGVSIFGVSGPVVPGNTVEGNYIGTDATGAVALPPGGSAGPGVAIDSSANNIVRGNVIANHHTGVSILSQAPAADGNVVEGNRIGTNASGTAALRNTRGVFVGSTVGAPDPSSDNRIGGTTAAQRNVISGNTTDGIFINGASATAIVGNYIGVAADGITPLPNLGHGVNISSGDGNAVGGIAPGEGNVIAHNGDFLNEDGVSIGSGTRNAVRGNSIHSNQQLGIDLAGDGPTANDAGDGDVGPNNRQNFPVMTSAAAMTGGGTSVAGTLNSTPSSSFELDFYASPDCGETGTQGKRYLGTAPVLTDGDGGVVFEDSLPGNVLAGDFVTATATDAQGNTSELSGCLAAVGGAFVVANANDSGAGSLRQAILDANARPGTDTIEFGIFGSEPHTISLASPLPVVSDSAVIDGTTQPGYVDAPVVEISGAALAAGSKGLDLAANGSTVRGLSITGFTGPPELWTGVGIRVGSTADGTVIEGNYLGVDPDGFTAQGNQVGVSIETSDSNLVGGTTPAARNVISGNTKEGVLISGAGTGNIVKGNHIGLNRLGSRTIPNGGSGVLIDGGTAAAVGGPGEGEGNVIAANEGYGISVASTAATIQGNVVGAAAENPNCVITQPASITGVTPSEITFVNNSGTIVQIYWLDYEGNRVLYSSLGPGASYTQPTWLTHPWVAVDPNDRCIGYTISDTLAKSYVIEPPPDLANGSGGILVDGDSNAIGGTSVGARNVISGNAGHGVLLAGGTDSAVLGNYVGTDAAGAVDIGNTREGIRVESGANTIGGNSPGARNVVSGNDGFGILLYGATGNFVQGNYVGTDVTGNEDLGNGWDGIGVDGGGNNVIGGTADGAGNLVSGNAAQGIAIFGVDFDNTVGNVVQGNRVGSSADGASALPNGGDGLRLQNAIDTTVGGTEPGAKNFFVNGETNGVAIYGAGSTGNVVARNEIAGNVVRGILVEDATNNTIGPGNTITDNGYTATGVAITGIATGNRITQNLIVANEGLGIDLGYDGVTPNDPGDGDEGANGRLNFPVIESVSNEPGTVVRGTFASAAQTTYGIEFFANTACDESGHGEGATPLGALSVTTNADGHADIVWPTPARLAPGTVVTATATDPQGNTSEFSACRALSADFVVSSVADAGAGTLRQAILDANARPGADTIRFGIPGPGVHTIAPLTPLPQATENVTIDGTTEDGYLGPPLIELDGTSTSGGGAGLQLNSVGGTVRGLAIYGFPINVWLVGSDHVVEDSYLGLRADGTPGMGENTGVAVYSSDALIHRNVVSGNATGVHVTQSFDGTGEGSAVRDNLIGTDPVGAAAIPNVQGVLVQSVRDVEIGGLEAGQGNVIAGNSGDGISVTGAANQGTLIRGNRIGVDSDGNALGNGADGILFSSGASSNSVGGQTAAAANTIAHNAGAGIALIGVQANAPIRNSIANNSIRSNGGLAIDLGSDGPTENAPPGIVAEPNEGLDHPVLTTISAVPGQFSVQGTATEIASGAPVRLEVYTSQGCHASGRGDLETLIGTFEGTFRGDGTFSVDLDRAPTDGEVLSATVTDTLGNTSEPSPCFGGAAPLSVTASLTSPASGSAGFARIPYSSISPSAVLETAAGVEAHADATATSETGEQARTRSAPMNDIPMNDINLAESPMNDIPMNDIGLGDLLDTRLGDLPLSAIPISTPGGWTGQLAGGPYANAPLHTVTLREAYRATPRPAVLTAGNPNELTLGQIQSAGTILGRLPVHALALGAAPLNDIPLNDIGAATPDVLERWCLALAGPPVNCTDPTTLQGETVVSLGLRGAPMNDIPMNDIPMNDIDLTHSPMNDIPMNDIDLSFTPMNDIPMNDILIAGSPMNDIPMNDILIAGSPMNDIPMNDIPMNDIANLVDCTLYDCTTGTLGDAFRAGALRPGATLGDLAGALAGFTLGDVLAFGDVTLGELAPFLPEGITLAHVILALVSPDAIAWEAASLPTLVAASTPAEGGATTYTLSFTLNGGSPGASLGALIELDLPGGFSPQSNAQLSGSTAVPVAGDVIASDVSFTLTGLEAGTPYTLEVPARPGLELGPTSATAKITPTGGAASPTLSAPLTVTETLEPNDDPNSPQPLRSDSIYINYLSSGTDADYFSYTAAPNRRIVFRGGQLPVDADFVVYGPPGSTPVEAFPDGPSLDGLPLADDGVELDVARQTLAPETLDDVDILPGRPLLALSINRGTEDEAAAVLSGPTGGTFLLQVRGYNRGFSSLPMMLRVQDQPSGDQLECGPRQFPFAGTPGAAPTLPTGLNTLFLVNYARLEATYGTVEADKVRNALGAQALADLAALGYPSAVWPVESDNGVSTAYAAWDQTPCSTERANNVVNEITRLVAQARAQRPGLRYVVLVGGDDIVPHRRIDDMVTIANERDYATSVDGENQFKAALLARKVLTDDSYVDVNPVPFMGRKLYVPDLAVGRLVERPDEIAGAIARFSQFNGTLDPQTALTMGYDFLEDGSQAIFGSLASLVPNGNSVQDINANWTASDMTTKLLGGSGADLASLNAHYDDHRALPADQNATGAQNDLFTTAALRDPANAAKLRRALVFSMGCHSGYSPTDILLGTTAPVDWAQAHAEQGSAGFVGNTGYGYGDTDVVGYTEKLMAIFAEELGRAPTVADALNRAKRRYIGLQSVVGVYDEKAAAELTFYGLPMYELPGATAPAPVPEPPTEEEPIAGLQASSFAVQPSFSTPQSGANGSYFTVTGGDIEAKHLRPLQPRLQLPAPDAAKGALITELESTDANDAFDPASSRPIVDDSSSEPGTDAGDSVYPAKLQSVTDTVDPDGTAGRALVLVPAQFFTDEDPGTRPGVGVERLFTRIEGLIYTSASERSTAPVFRLVDAVQLDGRIAFTVEVDDPGASDPAGGVLRNYVLAHDDDGWEGLDLVRTPGTSTWTGSLAVNGENVEYFVQAVGVGGVAVSTRKGRYFEARPAEPAPPDLGASVTGPAGNGGWFRGAATVALDGDGPFQVSVDGAPAEAYDDPFAVAGDGVHRVTVSRPGADPAELTIRIDATAPTAVIATPAEGATFGLGEAVPAEYTCLDAGSGVDGCAGTVANGAAIDTLSRGAKTFSVTATDIAGNPAAVVTTHYTVNRRPSAPGTPIATPTPNAGVFTLAWDPSTDADDDPVTYTLEHKDANDAAFSEVATGLTAPTYAFTAVAPEAEGTQVYRVTASDGSESGTFSPQSAAVVVDRTPPNAPLLAADRAPDYAGGGGWYRSSVVVTTTAQGDPPLADGSPGSGVALVSPPQTVSTSGSHTITGSAIDGAGNATDGMLAVQVDADVPLAAISCPATVQRGALASASWTAADLHSGLATAVTGSVALDTSTVGPRTAVSPQARDNVGLTATATCTYTVVYSFTGFLWPVDAPPVLNVWLAGLPLPLRFRLGGNQGLDVIADGYPRAKVMPCGSAPTDPMSDEEETSDFGLVYLAQHDQYVYIWKTLRAWRGTCRTFMLQLRDGTMHTANFKFK